MTILLSTEITQKQVNQRAMYIYYRKTISEHKAPERYTTKEHKQLVQHISKAPAPKAQWLGVA